MHSVCYNINMENNFNKIPKYDKQSILIVAVFAIIVSLFFLFIARPLVVSGNSMNNTLHNGDYCMTQVIGAKNAERGDIIVVDCDGATIIKRVIGTAGDTVSINYETDEVSINDKVLEEPYIADTDLVEVGDMDAPVTIPDGYVFVMGDNRNHSTDSRFDVVGLVSVDDIKAKVLCRIFPSPSLLGTEK